MSNLGSGGPGEFIGTHIAWFPRNSFRVRKLDHFPYFVCFYIRYSRIFSLTSRIFFTKLKDFHAKLKKFWQNSKFRKIYLPALPQSGWKNKPVLRAWLVRHWPYLERTKSFICGLVFVFVLAHEQAISMILDCKKLTEYILVGDWTWVSSGWRTKGKCRSLSRSYPWGKSVGSETCRSNFWPRPWAWSPAGTCTSREDTSDSSLGRPVQTFSSGPHWVRLIPQPFVSRMTGVLKSKLL